MAIDMNVGSPNVGFGKRGGAEPAAAARRSRSIIPRVINFLFFAYPREDTPGIAEFIIYVSRLVFCTLLIYMAIFYIVGYREPLIYNIPIILPEMTLVGIVFQELTRFAFVRNASSPIMNLAKAGVFNILPVSVIYIVMLITYKVSLPLYAVAAVVISAFALLESIPCIAIYWGLRNNYNLPAEVALIILIRSAATGEFEWWMRSSGL